MQFPASDDSIHHPNAARMNDPFDDGDIASGDLRRAQWGEDSDTDEEVHPHPITGNFEGGDISLARTTIHHAGLESNTVLSPSTPATPQFEYSHDLGEAVVPALPEEEVDFGVTSNHNARPTHESLIAANKLPQDGYSQDPPPNERAMSAVEEKGNSEQISTLTRMEEQDTKNSVVEPSSPPLNKSPPASPNASYRTSANTDTVSKWSHQQLAAQVQEQEENKDEGEWQDMPAIARYDIYDDDGKLIARENEEENEPRVGYAGLGDAAKGYTKVQLDEDAQSATSMDDDTAYLFNKERGAAADEFDEELRDPTAQMQATKDLLTDNQRIAYVGVVRLALADIIKDVESIERTRGAKKEVDLARDTIKLWAQKMMVRLYAHMELDSAEQLMIEQLAEHGLRPDDLTPTLMQNARVKNPVADGQASKPHTAETSNNTTPERRLSTSDDIQPETADARNGDDAHPPPYKETDGVDMPNVRMPSQLPTTDNLDIDIRWTVLCDLFLTLVSGSTYDARSRTLLERVGSFLSVPWLDICRFEKRVTDALEMQQEANKEDWDEAENMEKRRKEARNKRLIVMGLATVGGGLVIGLSAGLLAPVIGAGLAAGFTTIGVTGTGTFLAGAGGAAVIGTGAAVTGGAIGGKAANRRTGAVKTFEYRPLHNNKRVNLIVTVAGWMTGKVDDVRLPYSTVDPVMGDIYSIYWEPEMLRSMGDTINILATEALTQGLQQILGSTILIGLMAAIQLPVVLTKLAYLIDNPWSNSLSRADMAGLIFADSLIERSLGSRPITLVGFSLGSRLIFSCLRELAKRGAVGLIQNVYLFGSPIIANKDEYLKTKTVVSGRFVNGYATNDWILGYLFRATSGGLARVSGLAQVNVAGIENFDVTAMVPGHMAYRSAMPKLLREVGWAITSDEFEEIEDPDPDNHEKRQRELINEIEDARKELQEKPNRRFFGLFKSKKGVKKEWETYDESGKAVQQVEDPADAASAAGPVMFDVDAITREVAGLAAQGIEIKELKSTLPPMKLSPNRPTTPTSNAAAEASSSRQRTATPRSSSPALNITRPARVTSGTTDDDYNNYSTHAQPHSEEENITMTFGSPNLNRTSGPQQTAFDVPPTRSNRSATRFPISIHGSGRNSKSPQPSGSYTRGGEDQSALSLDLATTERRFGDHLAGSDPIARSPSSPPKLGRTAQTSRADPADTDSRSEGAAAPTRGVQRSMVADEPAYAANGRNVWAAEEDEDEFGHEREMEMTFE